VRLLLAIAPANLPRLNEISIDGPVLLFTAAVSLLAGAMFGAVPVVKYAAPHLAPALRGGGRSVSASRERHRVRSALVVVQVGLALLLLIGSGLMIRTFQTLRKVQPGFTKPEEVLALRIFIPETQVPDAVQVVRMQQEMLEKIAAIPGVISVAHTSKMPFEEFGWHDPIYAEDRVYAESQMPPLRSFKLVSPGLVKTMGNTVIAGRDLTWTDVYQKRPVAMVTENLARELWKEPEAAIGKRIRESRRSGWREVVGVVSDERDDGLNAKAPATAMFPSMMEKFGGDETFVRRSATLVIRSPRTGQSGFVDEVSRAVWSVNSNVPLANVRTLAEVSRKSLARTSFTLVMLAIAGGMALLLGVIGIYGVIAYSVSQRTREIGIRMALGSPREEVTRLFVGHGMRLALIGIACGLAAAVACTRLMSSLLFEVSPLDPATFGGVSLILLAAAGAASYFPALRAAGVDPVRALRAE
jgi:predicted permease